MCLYISDSHCCGLLLDAETWKVTFRKKISNEWNFMTQICSVVSAETVICICWVRCVRIWQMSWFIAKKLHSFDVPIKKKKQNTILIEEIDAKTYRLFSLLFKLRIHSNDCVTFEYIVFYAIVDFQLVIRWYK